MNNIIKKAAAYILTGIVILLTVIAVLGIWDIIEMRNVIGKLLGSLLVVFIASAVVLFIFAVIIRDDNK